MTHQNMGSSQQTIDWVRTQNWRAKQVRLEIESGGLDHTIHAICWEVMKPRAWGILVIHKEGVGTRSQNKDYQAFIKHWELLIFPTPSCGRTIVHILPTRKLRLKDFMVTQLETAEPSLIVGLSSGKDWRFIQAPSPLPVT